jgi:hypothetical protein
VAKPKNGANIGVVQEEREHGVRIWTVFMTSDTGGPGILFNMETRGEAQQLEALLKKVTKAHVEIATRVHARGEIQ